jgi:GT2 family glycosyltransferase
MNNGTLPSVCIIVLNYNGRELLERFMPSLVTTDYEPLELVVVDNASTDNSVDWLQTHYPQVTILKQSQNLFWAGGNNAGIHYALERGYQYVLFANNDIEPHPRWVREAVNFAVSHANYGIVGFRLFNRVSERSAFEAACRELSGINWHEVNFVMGCSLFCRAEIFTAIGLFDEHYVLYWEETDLERRALKAGWRAAEIGVPVWHLNEATTIQLGLKRAFYEMRSSIRFQLKLGGFKAGLRAAKSLLYYVSNPWTKITPSQEWLAFRYRPSNWFINTVLALSAIAWNVVHIVATRRKGKADIDRIAFFAPRADDDNFAKY